LLPSTAVAPYLPQWFSAGVGQQDMEDMAGDGGGEQVCGAED